MIIQSLTLLRQAQPDKLAETFLQGFGHIEIEKIHIRYQDPRKNINIGLNIGMDKEDGGVKIFEPTGDVSPKSFRSVDKENEKKEKPKQDVCKQIYFPLPSIFINPNATEMIDQDYHFEVQAKETQILALGALFTCSVQLDSRNIGKNVTISNPNLRDPLEFNLTKEQIDVALVVSRLQVQQLNQINTSTDCCLTLSALEC
jgi:hypothetical protein